MPQMALAKDEEVVQDFVLGPLHPNLGERVQIRTAGRNGPELQTVGLQDRAELGCELAVAVADDMRRPELGRFVGEDHAHVPCHLGHPDAIRIGCHAGKVNATSMEMDEEQHAIGDRPAQGPEGLREEVGGPNGFDVPLNEIIPTAVAAFRPRIEPVLLEDSSDRCGER